MDATNSGIQIGSQEAAAEIVNRVVTACANCRIVLEEGLEHYDMDTEVLGLTELVAEYMDQGSK